MDRKDGTHDNKKTNPLYVVIRHIKEPTKISFRRQEGRGEQDTGWTHLTRTLCEEANESPLCVIKKKTLISS